MAHLAESLPGMLEALSSVPSTTETRHACNHGSGEPGQQEQKFKVIFGFISNSRLDWDTQDLVLKH